MRRVVRQLSLSSFPWLSDFTVASQRLASGHAESRYNLVQERHRSGKISTIVITGTPSQGFTFSHRSGQRKQAVEHSPTTPSRGWVSNLGRKALRVLQATLMPAGYPHSVNPGFAAYAAWQGATNLACTANMVLASTFLLYSVGLSAGSAIPTAGALNWVLKDGLGQLGTLVLGKIVAHNFDVHSKSWFFISTGMLTTAIGLEISTIILPQHFLILGSLAGMIKGLAFMASSSTRSVFNLAFSKDNNIADLTAKSTSQWICASLFGTVVGSTLCTWVGQDSFTAGIIYVILSLITMYTALQSVKTIPLPTLNSTRLQLLCECFLTAAAAASRSQTRRPPGSHTSHALVPSPHKPAIFGSVFTQHQISQDLAVDSEPFGSAGGGGDREESVPQVWYPDPTDGAAGEGEHLFDEYIDPRVPNPAQLATEDPPLPFLMGDQRLLNPAILVGEPLERVFEDVGPELVVLLLTTYRLSHAIVLPRGPAVHVLLHQQASPRDICQAYMQACLLRRRMRAGSTVGLAVAQHAVEVQQSAERRAQEEAEALARGDDVPPEQGGDGETEWCVVRGTTSPALADLRIALQDTLQTAERLTSPFMRSLEAAGWRLEKIVVEAEKRRGHW